LFGEIIEGLIELNRFGRIVHDNWKELPGIYSGINIDVFIVMPNHMHGIITIDGNSKPIPEIIRGFKSYTARKINELRSMTGEMVWQRSYYEHIIRSDEESIHIGNYILNNAAQWKTDEENIVNKP
jgi:putative transposase